MAKKTITVSITENLEYFIEKEPVPVENLLTALQAYVQPGEELTVMLYVDRTVSIKDVIEVMDAANQLRIKLVLATEPKPQ